MTRSRRRSLSSLAVYARSSGALLGVVSIRAGRRDDEEIRFHWKAAPGFQGNPLVYPSGELDGPPPFLADFIRNHKARASTALHFLLMNHSAAQTALCFLPSTGQPHLHLEEQVLHLLRRGPLGGIRIAGRTLQRTLPFLPPPLREKALREIAATKNSVVAHAIALDLRLREGEDDVAACVG